MTNSRTIEISLDHLAAEVSSCPLVLPEAYRYSVTRIGSTPHSTSPSMDSSVAQREKHFWRAAEHYLINRFPHIGVDELVACRNLLWFDQDAPLAADGVSLLALVRRVARQYLTVSGTEAVPQLPPSRHFRGGISSCEPPEAAARRAWRWMTFSLPADLLLAALSEDRRPGPTSVRLLSPAIAGLLKEGYAETHLHYGVAFDFPMAWAALMYAAGGRSPDRLRPDSFCSPGAAYNEGRGLAMMVVRAALVRYFLAAFLSENHGVHRAGPFRAWLDSKLSLRFPEVPFSDPQDIRRAMRDLGHGEVSGADTGATTQQAFISLQGLYTRWSHSSTRIFPKRLAETQSIDPLSSFFPASEASPSVQLQFLVSGFSYLNQSPGDSDFERLFWQVERVRCILYRHCIHRPLIPGLTNFVRFYDRKRPLAEPLENVLIESAAHLSGRGLGLKSLEVRTSPAAEGLRQLKELRGVQKAFASLNAPGVPPVPETGLILHFLKSRGRDHDEGHPVAFDPDANGDPSARGNYGRYRWSGWFTKSMRQAKSIGIAIRRQPDLLRVLRGIDVCRDESGVPTWVVAPLFAEVRREIGIARVKYRDTTGKELPPLRTTVHAGEDFVHLSSGLRIMDEAIQFLQLTSGDRVGHGLALGVDPIAWGRKTDRLAMPREDRLFDLIWEKNWHASPDARFTTSRLEFVNREIERLGHEIFWPANSGSQRHFAAARGSLEFRDALFRFSELQKLGFPHGNIPPRSADQSAPSTWDLGDYLTDCGVYRRSRAVEWVEADHDAEAVAELQRLVRKRYAEAGITVEINPISNLLVGDLTDLSSHPLWRLSPRLGDSFGPSIRMCIGSDDPFVFSTNLPEEYQFLADSLVFAGKSHAEAREWLDLLRRMGLESRFTIEP